MEMEKELEQFRQEAQRLRAGRQGCSLPFPETLRAFAVRYALNTASLLPIRRYAQRVFRYASSASRSSGDSAGPMMPFPVPAWKAWPVFRLPRMEVSTRVVPGAQSVT